jgi:hypothetical protein
MNGRVNPRRLRDLLDYSLFGFATLAHPLQRSIASATGTLETQIFTSSSCSAVAVGIIAKAE